MKYKFLFNLFNGLLLQRLFSVTAQVACVPTNGPYGGRVNILKNINDEIYAGTHCGIYSSSDNGITWKNRCPGLGTCKNVKDIELINNILIAGTEEDGVFLSNDYPASKDFSSAPQLQCESEIESGEVAECVNESLDS